MLHADNISMTVMNDIHESPFLVLFNHGELRVNVMV